MIPAQSRSVSWTWAMSIPFPSKSWRFSHRRRRCKNDPIQHGKPLTDGYFSNGLPSTYEERMDEALPSFALGQARQSVNGQLIEKNYTFGPLVFEPCQSLGTVSAWKKACRKTWATPSTYRSKPALLWIAARPSDFLYLLPLVTWLICAWSVPWSPGTNTLSGLNPIIRTALIIQ